MVSDCHKNCGTLLYVAHYYSYYCIGLEKVFFSLLFNLLDVFFLLMTSFILYIDPVPSWLRLSGRG